MNITEDEHVILFTGHNKPDIARLHTDARKCAVLDSSCSSTVCGERWVEEYTKTLDHEDRTKVKVSDGHNIFKFEGGVNIVYQQWLLVKR